MSNNTKNPSYYSIMQPVAHMPGIYRLLNWIFPLPPEVEAVAEMPDDKFTAVYHPRKLQTESWILSDYKRPAVRSAILANKFHHDTHAARLLSLLLTQWCNERLTGAIVLVPIPLSKRRQRDRGYNQVTHILSHIKRPDVTVCDSLIRVRDTQPQANLPRAKRLQNMKEAFSYTPTEAERIPPSAQHILLIDDVYTTGATMAAARTALTPHLLPHQVLTCIAFAH
jgi:ComF family protein